jgi:hypothetical protein
MSPRDNRPPSACDSWAGRMAGITPAASSAVLRSPGPDAAAERRAWLRRSVPKSASVLSFPFSPGRQSCMTGRQFYDWQTAGGADDVMRMVDALERAAGLRQGGPVSVHAASASPGGDRPVASAACDRTHSHATIPGESPTPRRAARKDAEHASQRYVGRGCRGSTDADP